MKKNIAIIATGSELISGEVLNTNASEIAKALNDVGMSSTLQLSIADDLDLISKGIKFAQNECRVIITIGGLGPTLDDISRDALASALGIDLKFDDMLWTQLKIYLQQMSVEASECNKRQCYFPEGAEVLKNNHGTAAGCWLAHQGDYYIMLPGPPSECLPMFRDEVLPRLSKIGITVQRFKKSWYLLGVGESTLSEVLEPPLNGINVELGFRSNYPYLELKLSAADKHALDAAIAVVMPFIRDVIVGDTSMSAREQLIARLVNHPSVIFRFHDHVTCGLLESQFITPQLKPFFLFHEEADNLGDVNISINGLEEYWADNKDALQSLVTVVIEYNGESIEQSFSVKLRGDRTLIFVVEWVCWVLLDFYNTQIIE